MPREPVLSTWGPELVTTDLFSVAFTAIGGVADDELLSNVEKKRITEARRKSRSQLSETAEASQDLPVLLQRILQ